MLRGNDDLAFVVVGHDGHDVLRVEPTDRLARRLARLDDLVAAHRARAVEHDREVHGRTVCRHDPVRRERHLHVGVARPVREPHRVIRLHPAGDVRRGRSESRKRKRRSNCFNLFCLHVMSFPFPPPALLPATADIKPHLAAKVVMARQRDCKDFAKYYTRASAPPSSAAWRARNSRMEMP